MSFQRAAACLAIVLLAGPASAQVYQGKQLVKAELIADTTAVVPGKPFTAGLLLHMAPGWHTYWKFSGDAGLPSELNWKLPAGWKAGELQWPLPLKMKDPGDIQTYGYADEVLLLQEITPPATLTESKVELSADANWLVCERLCIPGNANLKLDLPVGSAAAAANAEVFDRFRKLLPNKWPEADSAQSSWKRTEKELQLTVNSKQLAGYANVDFFPLPEAKVINGHPEVAARAADQVTFKIPLESADQNVSSIGGVVVFARAADWSDRSGWILNPVLDATATTAPAAKSSERATSESLAGRLLSAPAGGGVLTFLFYGFIGGLILNLMPCVLPVISLKIFGFVQQAGQSRGKILRSGLAFTAGIFAWFIGLAVVLIVLKGAGHSVSWAAQFTNPYFVLFMSAVVLVFALNLFGVFEISLPQSMTRGVLGLTAAEGNAASFFQGVFATVLATPCTAPFLGTALGFAFSQSAVIILAMFVAIALGMALPYLLLSAQPAWLRFLPKPGPWMERVKQFMGFLLLATLLFLLYVLGAQRGLEAAIWASCFLLVLSIVCWMKGAFMTPVASTGARVATVLIGLVLIAVSGAYFINGKFRASKLDSSTQAQTNGWARFTPETLAAELDQGHVVFIDFTAAWCLTCKFNEASVLESSAVREAFQRHGVVKMKADWTNGDPEITKLLQHFGRPGVPLYVLYRSKSEEPVVFPELLTKSIVLEKLETISRTVASQ